MAHSIESWAKARGDYESGKGVLEELGIKYGISRRQIYRVSREEGWIRNKTKELVEATIQENMVQIAARKGMTKEKLVQFVIDGIQKPDKLEYSGEKDHKTGKFAEGTVIVTPIPDYETRLKYIQEFNKMAGWYQKEEEKSATQNFFGPSIVQIPDNGRN